MKTTVLLTFALTSLFTGASRVAGAEHTSGSSPRVIQVCPGRNDDTRIRSVPKLVQKRVVSREPIQKWVPKPGHEYIDEKNPTRRREGRWVTTGYRVTYIEVYDNGTSKTYTVTE